MQVSSLLMKLSVCRAGAEAEAAAWPCRLIVPCLERIVTAQQPRALRAQWASGESQALLQLGALLTVRIIAIFLLLIKLQTLL